MRLYQMQVTKTGAYRTAPARIPRGIVGAVLEIRFSPEWEGLKKTVVFRAGEVTKDVLNVESTVVIPAECTQTVGTLLEVGIYGTDAENTVAIPTLWAAIGRVCEAADPSGDETTDPVLPVWAQRQDQIDQLERQGVTQNEVGQAVTDYMTANPITAAGIGAAPAGFGLGTDARSIRDCNQAVASGWYTASGSANTPEGNAYGWLLVSARDANYIRQDYYICHATPAHFERYYVEGAWSEWANVSKTAFVPSGYGWGEKHAPDAPGLDPDYVDTTCVFIANTGSVPADGVWFGSFFAQADGANGSMVMEALNGSCVGCKVIRQKLNGVWQPWEWVTPPMVPGVEYRTTERYNNQPVYVKRTGSVQLPASSARSISYCDDTNVKATPVSVQPLYTASCAAEYSAIAGIPPFIEKVWADANELGFGNSVSFTSNSYTDTGYDTDSATVSAIVKYIKEVVA